MKHLAILPPSRDLIVQERTADSVTEPSIAVFLCGENSGPMYPTSHKLGSPMCRPSSPSLALLSRSHCLSSRNTLSIQRRVEGAEEQVNVMYADKIRGVRRESERLDS
jgi:hypothetical protein